MLNFAVIVCILRKELYMTAKELIEQLQKVAPDTEIIGGTWNGHVDTYTVIDRTRVFLYDQVYADFFGTPGAFDDRLMEIKVKGNSLYRFGV